MTNVEILLSLQTLGARADAIEIWLESGPDASEIRIKNAEENLQAMRQADSAARQLQKRIDTLSAYIMDKKREVDYTRNLIQDIIKYER